MVGTNSFPNPFSATGPGSSSVLASMTVGIEHHVEWIAQCIDWLRTHGATRMEAEQHAEDTWVDHVNKVAAKTLFPTCNSWHVGANIPGKPRVFLPYVGGFPRYAVKCRDIPANGYAGFKVSCARFSKVRRDNAEGDGHIRRPIVFRASHRISARRYPRP